MFKTEKTEVASVHRILQRELEEVVEVATERLTRCPVVKMAYEEAITANVEQERRAFEALEELVKREVLSCAQIDLYGVGLKAGKAKVCAGLSSDTGRAITVVIEVQGKLARFGKYRKIAAIGATISVAK